MYVVTGFACLVIGLFLGYRAASKFGMDAKEKKARNYIASIIFHSAQAAILKERLKRSKKSELLAIRLKKTTTRLASVTAEFCMFIGARTRKGLALVEADTFDIINSIEGDSDYIAFIKGIQSDNDRQDKILTAKKEQEDEARRARFGVA